MSLADYNISKLLDFTMFLNHRCQKLAAVEVSKAQR